MPPFKDDDPNDTWHGPRSPLSGRPLDTPGMRIAHEVGGMLGKALARLIDAAGKAIRDAITGRKK